MHLLDTLVTVVIGGTSTLLTQVTCGGPYSISTAHMQYV